MADIDLDKLEDDELEDSEDSDSFPEGEDEEESE